MAQRPTSQVDDWVTVSEPDDWVTISGDTPDVSVKLDYGPRGLDESVINKAVYRPGGRAYEGQGNNTSMLGSLWDAMTKTPDVPGAAQDSNPIIRAAGVIPDMAYGAASAVMHPIDTVANATAARREQLIKAREHFGKGQYTEAFGHGAAGVIPFLGPAAASIGEQGASGDVAGMLANTAMVAAPLASAATEPVAGMLRRSGTKSMESAFNATGGNKAIMERIAPELADRGVTAMTQRGLQSKIQGSREVAGETLGEAYAQVPKTETVKVQPILDAIEKSKWDNDAMGQGPNGPVINNPQMVKAADDLKAIIEQYAPEASYESATKLLRNWDRTVAKAKGYVQQDLGVAADMMRDANSAIRDVLAEGKPDITKLKAEYSLWANADKVISDTIRRKNGQAVPMGEQIATAAGAAGGMAAGGIAGALEMAAVFRTLTKVMRSTGWRTVAAKYKTALAKAIAGNDVRTAQLLAIRIGANSVDQEVNDEP